jgi:hypothetical protein
MRKFAWTLCDLCARNPVVPSVGRRYDRPWARADDAHPRSASAPKHAHWSDPLNWHAPASPAVGDADGRAGGARMRPISTAPSGWGGGGAMDADTSDDESEDPFAPVCARAHGVAQPATDARLRARVCAFARGGPTRRGPRCAVSSLTAGAEKREPVRFVCLFAPSACAGPLRAAHGAVGAAGGRRGGRVRRRP